MAQTAKCGMMLWDGKSQRTIHNILNLSLFRPDKSLYKLQGAADLRALLARCDPRDIERAEHGLAALHPRAVQDRLPLPSP